MTNYNSNKYYDKYKRNQEARVFYKSAAWEKVRKLALIRDNYLCQECLRNGMITKADVVHHIKELKDYPELALVLDNLECLCHSCHNKEHPEKGKKEKKTIPKSIKIVDSNHNPTNGW